MRFRYSTDAAYLDTGWFVDDVTVDGQPATLTPQDEGWILIDGAQVNEWAVQVIASCDLTPGTDSEGEITDGAGNHVYRFVGDSFTVEGFDTTCNNGSKSDVKVAISNMPSGDLTVLNADYDFALVGTGKAKGKD